MRPILAPLCRRLAALGLLAVAACQAGERLAPSQPPGDVMPFAFYLDIDMVNGTVRVIPPGQSATASAGGPAFSLAGAELIGVTTSNVVRSPVGQPVANKRTITFDLALSNRLSVTDLVTPSFPLAPNGAQGIIAFPYTVAAFGVQGGKAVPNADWNGDGVTPHSGDPVNFFNDFGSCGTAVTSDCYRWELFPAPLAPGQVTAARKVGFTVDKNVTSVGVYLVVAADLLDHPPVPQPGLGALMGTVTSGGGPLAGATVTVTPGGQSAVTDALGKYLLAGLAVGNFTAAVSGVPAGCTTPASNTGTISSGGVSSADFSVSCPPPTGAIAGTASSPQNGVLAGATVELRTIPALVLVSQTTTNTAGVYGFSGVAPGGYSISLTGLTPPCPATGGPVQATVVASATANGDISVNCTATTGSITGTASSPQTGVLAGATVELRTIPALVLVSQTTTNGAGAYQFSGVAAGGYSVTLTALTAPCPATGGPVAVTVAAGVTATADISVDCSAPGNQNLTGVVTSPTLGALNGVTIAAVVNGVSGPTTVSAGAGNFGFLLTWPGTAAATVSLTIAAGLPAGCVVPPAVSIQLPKGGTGNAVLTVDCSGGSGGGSGSLTLTVANVMLNSLPGLLVELQGPAGYFFQGTSDASGQVQVLGLGAGSYTARLLGPGLPASCTPPITPFSITSGAATPVALVLTCSIGTMPVIMGQVTSPTLGALGGVTVSVTSNVTTALPTQTDAGGDFSFDRRICGANACNSSTFAVTLTGGLPVSCVAPAAVTVPGPLNGIIVPVPISVDCTGGGGVGTGTIGGSID
ncbi:MAG: hypothetical protein ABI742_09800, partial [Gemmatimonadota bacterium]